MARYYDIVITRRQAANARHNIRSAVANSRIAADIRADRGREAGDSELRADLSPRKAAL
jgi:hypothetical protein